MTPDGDGKLNVVVRDGKVKGETKCPLTGRYLPGVSSRGARSHVVRHALQAACHAKLPFYPGVGTTPSCCIIVI